MSSRIAKLVLGLMILSLAANNSGAGRGAEPAAGMAKPFNYSKKEGFEYRVGTPFMCCVEIKMFAGIGSYTFPAKFKTLTVEYRKAGKLPTDPKDVDWTIVSTTFSSSMKKMTLVLTPVVPLVAGGKKGYGSGSGTIQINTDDGTTQTQTIIPVEPVDNPED